MHQEDVKVGDVVMIPWWSERSNVRWTTVPALVSKLNETVGDVVFVAPSSCKWGKDWVPYNKMRKADAKTQDSMKLIVGRKRSKEFGAFRYMVACAAPLGERDTIIAGCRKWATFAEAFAYYELVKRLKSTRPENPYFYAEKAAASKAILEDLQAKYKGALLQQRRAVDNYQKKYGGIFI